jgi:hypothetical protein
LSFGLQSLIGADFFKSAVAPSRNNAGQLTAGFFPSLAIGNSILMFNEEVEQKGTRYHPKVYPPDWICDMFEV